jgi:NAD(P)-dependent dehydrogenase (short-subunit alcohol dehydrogenase family)
MHVSTVSAENSVADQSSENVAVRRMFHRTMGRLGLVWGGRRGRPEDIANAVLFFASDDSSLVGGVELFVDGG